MIIDRSVRRFVVYGEDPVLTALEKISANPERIVFCVGEHGHLIGSISDGDVRRWIATQATVDLGRPCSEVANTAALSAPASATPADIRQLFAGVIDHVPLLDAQGHLVAVAVNRNDAFHVGRHGVGQGHRTSSSPRSAITTTVVSTSPEAGRPRRRGRRRLRQVPDALDWTRSTAAGGHAATAGRPRRAVHPRSARALPAPGR